MSAGSPPRAVDTMRGHEPVEVRSAPQVSVVVPCFNAAEFIGRTIGTVLSQTFTDLELIVVDDKSTDESAEIVRTYVRSDARVRLIEMPRNAGAPAVPRNAGVRAARADWVAFLDADDLWHPRKLELQMAAVKIHSASMCSSQMVDFRDERDIVVGTAPSHPAIRRVTLRQQLLKYRTPTSSIVIRRDLMQRFPFNEDLNYKAREDTDCFTRVHEYMPYSVKIVFPLVYYRQQASQISGNKWRMVRRHLQMLRKYRLASGRSLGVMAYVYTCTHFLASIYLRWIRHTL
jgi:teichuronic acid biosynthesis glycosyltransferase TuaG